MPIIIAMTWDEVPESIKKEIAQANIEDILDRYNDDEYHQPHIRNEILATHFIELIPDECDE